MPNFLKDLYAKNKLLAWVVGIVVLPLIVLYFFKDIALASLANSAQKDVDDAKKENKKLQAEIDSTKTEIKNTDDKVAGLNAAANKVQETDDEDWHKNRGSVLMIVPIMIMIFFNVFFLTKAYFNYIPAYTENKCFSIPVSDINYVFILGLGDSFLVKINKSGWFKDSAEGTLYVKSGDSYDILFDKMKFKHSDLRISDLKTVECP
jgi:cell division protein FtsB